MADLIEAIDARGIATLTLNRPERHNAFDDALIAALAEALARVGARAEVRVLVLRGAGRSFSAGADLGWMRRMAGASEAENRADALRLARMLDALDRLPKPTVALVQGNAYGGGVGLAAACDIAIAAERASFALSEVRLGLVPATIAPFVIRAIGPRQARRFFLTAEPIPAARAREIGLVHEVVPEADLDAALAAVLDALLAGAPGAQAEAKALVRLCEACETGDALGETTSALIAARRASPEGQAGLAAFFERRTPGWRVTPPSDG